MCCGQCGDRLTQIVFYRCASEHRQFVEERVRLRDRVQKAEAECNILRALLTQEREKALQWNGEKSTLVNALALSAQQVLDLDLQHCMSAAQAMTNPWDQPVLYHYDHSLHTDQSPNRGE